MNEKGQQKTPEHNFVFICNIGEGMLVLERVSFDSRLSKPWTDRLVIFKPPCRFVRTEGRVRGRRRSWHERPRRRRLAATRSIAHTSPAFGVHSRFTFSILIAYIIE